MKRTGFKKMSVLLLSVVMLAILYFALTGCGGKLQVNGPEYEYNVSGESEKYEFTGNIKTNVVPDEEVKIDGVFDEDFYTGRKWFKGKKIKETETGTLEMTTYFAKSGIVVAAKIKDSRPAVHSNTVATGNLTCFNGYFAFGDAKTQNDGLYEVECTAGNRFKISRFGAGGVQVVKTDLENTPLSAVKRTGNILAGECYEYSLEYFMPYSLFGKTSRPESIFFNPTMISAALDENGESVNTLRTWYNFGYEQSSGISKWATVNQGYIFDRNGFVSNAVTISATGGTVSEEWGYDFCLTGDTVNFNITADQGKTLSILTVNGIDKKSSVVDGKLSVVCKGDIDIVAVFE